MSDDNAEPFEAAPVKVPKRLTSAQALKAATVRDYTRNAGIGGMPTDSTAIEVLAVADLNLAEAYNRDTPAAIAPSVKTAEEIAADRAASDRALNAAMAEGVELVRNVPREPGPQFDLPASYAASERWQLAKGRLARIVSGASAPVRFPSGAFDFRSMTSTCECPALAYRFLEAWFNFDLRYTPQTARHNPFYEMSHRDASLKLARVVEDLCDASTGTSMGSWLTPK